MSSDRNTHVCFIHNQVFFCVFCVFLLQNSSSDSEEEYTRKRKENMKKNDYSLHNLTRPRFTNNAVIFLSLHKFAFQLQLV